MKYVGISVISVCGVLIWNACRHVVARKMAIDWYVDITVWRSCGSCLHRGFIACLESPVLKVMPIVTAEILPVATVTGNKKYLSWSQSQEPCFSYFQKNFCVVWLYIADFWSFLQLWELRKKKNLQIKSRKPEQQVYLTRILIRLEF